MFDTKDNETYTTVEVKEKELSPVEFNFSSTGEAVKKASKTDFGFSVVTGLVVGSALALYTHNIYAVAGSVIMAIGFKYALDVMEWGGWLKFSK